METSCIGSGPIVIGSYITTLPAARASVRGIAARRQGGGGVASLQEYHSAMAR